MECWCSGLSGASQEHYGWRCMSLASSAPLPLPLIHRRRYALLCDWAEGKIEETLTFYRLPQEHHMH